NYFHNMRDWAEHRELRDRLLRTRCQWILSSYNIPEIVSHYKDNPIIPVRSFSGMKVEKDGSARVPNDEVLITNYPPPGRLRLERPDAAAPNVLFDPAAAYSTE